MNHELIDYRYHARDLQLTQLWEQQEAFILNNIEVIHPHLTALHSLLTTPTFLLPAVIERFFKDEAQQTQILSPAIGYQIRVSFIKFLFEKVSQIASARTSLSVDLDQNFDFQRMLPPYNLFFPSDTLAAITLDSMHRGSDKLLELIGTKSPILSPRRDIAPLMFTPQETLVPGEKMVFIQSDVEEVGLKLVFPPDQNFPKRFVYIHSLQ